METNKITLRDFAAATAGALAVVGDLSAPTVQSKYFGSGGVELLSGSERADLARGTIVNGTQMYIEYAISTQLRHPYPIVMVHGGGGQGTDWMCTPDGRPGRATYFLQEGYSVYIVRRPGHTAHEARCGIETNSPPRRATG
jgi:pimeloyl-ACP methyl ester carboxylesterase